MSACQPGTPAPTDVPASADAPPPGVGRTALVTDRSAPMVLTGRQETDSRGAVVRALKEYLEQVDLGPEGGHKVRLARVVPEPADPEDSAVYPAACVYAVGPQTYDAPGTTPGTTSSHVGGTLAWHVRTNDVVLNLRVEVFTTDKEGRSTVMAGLERALVPVDHRNGLLLSMPHYFGARARYSLRSASFDDDEQAIARRWRRATLVVEARGPVIRLSSYGRTQYKVKVDAVAATEEL